MSEILAQIRSTTSDRGLRIIARSLYKELRQNGFDQRQIVSLSTELLGMVTTELRDSAHDDAFSAAGAPPAA